MRAGPVRGAKAAAGGGVAEAAGGETPASRAPSQGRADTLDGARRIA